MACPARPALSSPLHLLHGYAQQTDGEDGAGWRALFLQHLPGFAADARDFLARQALARRDAALWNAMHAYPGLLRGACYPGLLDDLLRQHPDFFGTADHPGAQMSRTMLAMYLEAGGHVHGELLLRTLSGSYPEAGRRLLWDALPQATTPEQRAALFMASTVTVSVNATVRGDFCRALEAAGFPWEVPRSSQRETGLALLHTNRNAWNALTGFTRSERYRELLFPDKADWDVPLGHGLGLHRAAWADSPEAHAQAMAAAQDWADQWRLARHLQHTLPTPARQHRQRL